MHMLKMITFAINEFLWGNRAKFLQIELYKEISYFYHRHYCYLLEEIDIRLKPLVPVNLCLIQEHPLKA